MPTLILPPRYTSDSIGVSKAAVQAGWEVERLSSWRVPAHLQGDGPDEELRWADAAAHSDDQELCASRGVQHLRREVAATVIPATAWARRGGKVRRA